ncbi:Dymeclin and/or Hid1 domain containing protein [Asbolus verrucosus]|uniref:Dymeclin n=1 Tax=Asbolus verrucosus TaxID=1661398 RepID=A0A482W8I9_ASBVE|nr:Dymeclin and/or Hid1 domain containing protein [Asbolus verrucosus]
MGTAVSKNLDLSTNDYLQKFVSSQAISQNDPFWNRFVAFNISPPMTSNDQLALESKIENLCQLLLRNNLTSGNFGTIIDVFLSRASELLAATNTDASLFIWQSFNILFIIRCILKFLTETVTEEQLIEQVEYNGNGTRLEMFVDALVKIIVDVEVKDTTYGIHLEAVTILLVFLSVQLHSGRKSDQSNIYRLIMRGRHTTHAPLLIKCLLMNFMNQEKVPIGYGANTGHSLVLGIAAELWSILTFSRKSDEITISENSDYQEVPLATQSLLLVLVLVHHWTTKNNPYRNSLFLCRNSADNNPMAPTQAHILSKIDYTALYTTICKKASGDVTTLLLYLLLHRNDSFKTFLLNRLDLDHLIIPILKTLYNAPHSNSHHIYMSLIILLILSEDDSFNKTIHEIKLKNVVWYTERTLTEVSLGGLLVLVVIRTVQYNMLKMRDKYLHTNCLAALANMSAQFRDLHPYVSQRLVSLFETLAKRYQKLSTKFLNGKSKQSELAITVAQDGDDMEQDITVLEEVLRMVLEIFNSCLTSHLVNNPNLVYTLLYNKHIFEPFKENVAFQDIIQNIDIIIKYFSNLLDDKTQQNEVDAYQVLYVIQQGAKRWPKDKLKKFPDLKFKYVEEDQPEEFFIPYVWTLVSQQSILHWTSDCSPLLSSVC